MVHPGASMLSTQGENSGFSLASRCPSAGSGSLRNRIHIGEGLGTGCKGTSTSMHEPVASTQLSVVRCSWRHKEKPEGGGFAETGPNRSS